MKDKKVGTWMGSQQFQVLAFMEKNGLDPKKDIELVKKSVLRWTILWGSAGCGDSNDL